MSLRLTFIWHCQFFSSSSSFHPFLSLGFYSLQRISSVFAHAHAQHLILIIYLYSIRYEIECDLCDWNELHFSRLYGRNKSNLFVCVNINRIHFGWVLTCILLPDSNGPFDLCGRKFSFSRTEFQEYFIQTSHGQYNLWFSQNEFLSKKCFFRLIRQMVGDLYALSQENRQIFNSVPNRKSSWEFAQNYTTYFL